MSTPSAVLRSGLILATPILFLGLLACGGDYYDRHYDGFITQSGYLTKAVAVADVLGNGKPAVISANAIYGEGLPHRGFITVRLQDPANVGHFLDPIESDTGHDPVALALADLSGGTGLPDLVVAHRQPVADPEATTTLSLQKHDPTGSGKFQAPTTLSLGSRNPTDVVLGDLNHDGKPDIVVAADGANTVLVFFQNADGSFTSTPLAAGGVPTSVAVADLNHDGYQDLVVATTGGTVSVLIQDAANAGTFLPIKSYAVGSNPVSVKVAPLSDPNFPDILTANYGTDSAPTTQGLSVLLHDPAQAGGFLTATSYDTGDYLASSVAVGDPAMVSLVANTPYVVVANQGAPGWPGSLMVFPTDPAHPGALLAPVPYEGAYGPSAVVIGALSSNAIIAADGGTFLRYETSTPGAFGTLLQLRQ